MTEAEFQRALKEALEARFSDIPDPEKLKYDYVFSARFERRMRRMIRRFDLLRSQAEHEAHADAALLRNNDRRTITVGRFTMKRAATIAIIAALMLALVACTVHFAIIWHETNNEKQGTLDVTFELGDPEKAADAYSFKEPIVPAHYVRTVTFQKNDILDVTYEDIESGSIIYYGQSPVSETMSLSIDNEAESFAPITINGHKGYSAEEPTYSYIIWSDGISLYTMMSNISFNETVKIAESIK